METISLTVRVLKLNMLAIYLYGLILPLINRIKPIERLEGMTRTIYITRTNMIILAWAKIKWA